MFNIYIIEINLLDQNSNAIKTKMKVGVKSPSFTSDVELLVEDIGLNMADVFETLVLKLIDAVVRIDIGSVGDLVAYS